MLQVELHPRPFVVVLIAHAALWLVPVPALAADRVRLHSGFESGDVTDTSPTEVTLDTVNGSQKIAVPEIRSILFDDEPTELTQARLNVRNGGYRTARDTLAEIDLADVDRDLTRQDIEFYTALCAAKLALAGTGEIVDSGRQLNEFVRSHPQSFHYLEAVELMGDLLMASGRYPAAQRQYAELAKAPWSEYQMRAGVLLGRTLQAQDQHREAIAEFDRVLEIPAEDEAAEQQQLSATLGKAVSLAETEQLDESVQMIEGVIRNADPENQQLQARAYNALGTCYERAEKPKDALLAFLHVDVLYSAVPEAHAKSLGHLVRLWNSLGEEARAREAQQQLDSRYEGSRWAQ